MRKQGGKGGGRTKEESRVEMMKKIERHTSKRGYNREGKGREVKADEGIGGGHGRMEVEEGDKGREETEEAEGRRLRG